MDEIGDLRQECRELLLTACSLWIPELSREGATGNTDCTQTCKRPQAFNFCSRPAGVCWGQRRCIARRPATSITAHCFPLAPQGQTNFRVLLLPHLQGPWCNRSFWQTSRNLSPLSVQTLVEGSARRSRESWFCSAGVDWPISSLVEKNCAHGRLLRNGRENLRGFCVFEAD